jgi:hypothetical protein
VDLTERESAGCAGVGNEKPEAGAVGVGAWVVGWAWQAARRRGRRRRRRRVFIGMLRERGKRKRWHNNAQRASGFQERRW